MLIKSMAGLFILSRYYFAIDSSHGSIEQRILYFFAMDVMEHQTEPQTTSEAISDPSAFNVDDILSARLAEADQALVDIDGDTLSQIFKPSSDRLKLSQLNSKPEPVAADKQVTYNYSDHKLTLKIPQQIELKAENGTSRKSSAWADALEQLKSTLNPDDRPWPDQTLVYLQTGDRLLDTRHLQELAEILTAHNLVLHSVATQRRQSAINAATAGFSVEQGAIDRSLINNDRQPSSNKDNPEDPLYVTMTIRSGAEIVHSGSVIIFGDVNAGAEIIAAGDILVWGKLKGKAHAGVKGNAQAVIMALHLEATQLRIADFIARVDTPTTNFFP
jgi:septum site-determining protein MinC